MTRYYYHFTTLIRPPPNNLHNDTAKVSQDRESVLANGVICTIVYKVKATYQRYILPIRPFRKKPRVFSTGAAREVSPLEALQRNYTSLFDDCNLHTRRSTFIVSRGTISQRFLLVFFAKISRLCSRLCFSFCGARLATLDHFLPGSLSPDVLFAGGYFRKCENFHGTCFFLSFFLCFTCKHVVRGSDKIPPTFGE